MISLLFYSVFFLFSSTKIGHGCPSVKNRYAISDKNILRSYVVRYFYLKFLACRSSMPLEMHKKKGKKCGWRCVEAVSEQLFMFTPITPIIEDFSKIGKFLLFYFVTFEQLSRISFVRYFSAGRFAPLPGADGEADRRRFPARRRAEAVCRERRRRNPQEERKTGVISGRWSGWRLAAIVEA